MANQVLVTELHAAEATGKTAVRVPISLDTDSLVQWSLRTKGTGFQNPQMLESLAQDSAMSAENLHTPSLTL
jgi:hypothetical protein